MKIYSYNILIRKRMCYGILSQLFASWAKKVNVNLKFQLHEEMNKRFRCGHTYIYIYVFTIVNVD